MTLKILIGSPINQSYLILKQFLKSLDELERDEFSVDYMFMDDNEQEASSELLQSFQKYHQSTIIIRKERGPEHLNYERDEYTHYWGEQQIWKVASLKDEIIQYAYNHEYDYLFLIDSDLVLHPKTLKQLVSQKKDIVSNIFWTKWQPDMKDLPQVWLRGEYTLYDQYRGEQLSDEEISLRTDKFLNKLRIPGLYEVGGLGACTLISKIALGTGISFKEIKNLSYCGEDRHFCVRAQVLGIPLFVDTHYPAYHIYRESELQGLESYKRRWKREKENRITISLCMIVKDEEDALPKCLTSVRDIVDEIIVVDTGSVDQTKSIAAKFTDKIYDFSWIDDFSAARNFAFSKATKDYILWLDADDTLEQKDQNLFFELKETIDSEIDSVTMHYHLSFNSEGKVTHSLRRNRLVRRDRQFKWIGAVHEYLEVSGNIFHSDIAITHKKEKAHTDRNLLIYRSREEKDEKFTPRDLYYFANELKDHCYYDKAIEKYEEFLNGGKGWVEDNIAACLKLAECYGQMKEPEKQLRALLSTFEYDLPRAEVCCKLGSFYIEIKDYTKAIHWLKVVEFLEHPETMGVVDHASRTWLPHLLLCVCYDRIGQPEEAERQNTIALSYNPDHPSILYNKSYFEQRRLTQKEDK